MKLQSMRHGPLFRAISFVQTAVFIFSTFALPIKAYAQSVMELPAPGSMVLRSDAYVPVMLRAVKIHPDQPFVFDFIVDSGNTHADQALIKSETQKLVKYFLASLTVPEKDLWVNLSPYEHNRIVPEAFGQTQMGRDLLAQDYVLKQLAASLSYPENDLGKEFWARVYAKAKEAFGTTDIPKDTINKVWIMPDQAQVYELGDTAIVGKTHLKVLMEQDYLALQKNSAEKSSTADDIDQADQAAAGKLSSDVMREVILPEIEKEVNTGKNFALLRQVYQALILAAWYKNNLKDSLLAQVYSNQNKTAGVDIADKNEKEKIYQRYVDAYKQGVFNYIKEETDPLTKEALPRKYFSGGADMSNVGDEQKRDAVREAKPGDTPAEALAPTEPQQPLLRATVDAVESGKAGKVVKAEDYNADYGKGLQRTFAAPVVSSSTSTGQGLFGGFTPTAEKMTEEQKKRFPIKQFDPNAPEAKRPGKKIVHFMPLLAGIATSMKIAPSFYEMMSKKIGKQVKPGTKGTDMYLQVDGEDVFVNPLETHLVCLLDNLNRGMIPGVVFEPMINEDSKQAVEDFFETPYLQDRLEKIKNPRTWRQVLEATPGFEFAAPVMQDLIPVYSKKSKAFTDRFRAPGGHGFLVYDLLMRMATGQITTGMYQILNGDGFNNNFVELSGSIEALGAGITFVTGTRGPNDQKVGLGGIDADDVPAGMEVAAVQGEEAKARFKTLGLIKGDEPQIVFLNNIAIDADTIAPIVKDLYETLGREAFEAILFQGLIRSEKPKEYLDENGVKQVEQVIQLEIAAPNVLLSFNKFWITSKDPRVVALRHKYDRPALLAALNLPKEVLAFFFSPIKTPMDLVLLQNCFKVNQARGKIEPRWGGDWSLPRIGSMDAFYSFTVEALSSFTRVGMQFLEEINVKGVVYFENVDVRGVVFVKNSSGKEVHIHELIAAAGQEGPAVIGEAGKISLYQIEKDGKLTVKFFDTQEEAKKSFDAAEDRLAARNKISVDAVSAEDDSIKAGNKWNEGGIDFNPAALNLKVERTGERIKVTVDPAEVQRIKADGVSGFTPVIINIMPVKSMLPALGLAPGEGGGAAT